MTVTMRVCEGHDMTRTPIEDGCPDEGHVCGVMPEAAIEFHTGDPPACEVRDYLGNPNVIVTDDGISVIGE